MLRSVTTIKISDNRFIVNFSYLMWPHDAGHVGPESTLATQVRRESQRIKRVASLVLPSQGGFRITLPIGTTVTMHLSSTIIVLVSHQRTSPNQIWCPDRQPKF